MAFLLQHNEFIIVGKGDGEPLVCPNCGKIQWPKVGPQPGTRKGKIRCVDCKFQAPPEQFEGTFTELMEAKVLVAT